MDLAELRKKIDAVDNEIVRLLNDRYRTVIEIGTWKKEIIKIMAPRIFKF